MNDDGKTSQTLQCHTVSQMLQSSPKTQANYEYADTIKCILLYNGTHQIGFQHIAFGRKTQNTLRISDISFIPPSSMHSKITDKRTGKNELYTKLQKDVYTTGLQVTQNQSEFCSVYNIPLCTSTMIRVKI
jgi:hypothetical protein